MEFSSLAGVDLCYFTSTFVLHSRSFGVFARVFARSTFTIPLASTVPLEGAAIGPKSTEWDGTVPALNHANNSDGGFIVYNKVAFLHLLCLVIIRNPSRYS